MHSILHETFDVNCTNALYYITIRNNIAWKSQSIIRSKFTRKSYTFIDNSLRWLLFYLDFAIDFDRLSHIEYAF